MRCGTLQPVRFELHVLQVGAEHHDGAVAAVVARIGEFEGIGAPQAQAAVVVAREAQLGEGDRVVEELQVIALARGASGLHRALARAQAVQPEEYPRNN